MTAHRHFYLSAVLLIIGAILYILFREPVIFTRPFLNATALQPLIPLSESPWSYFLRFIAPDALWCAALLSYASSFQGKLLRGIAVIMAPAMEIGQLIGFVPGTFDIADLIAYSIITIIFLLKWKKENSDSQCLETA